MLGGLGWTGRWKQPHFENLLSPSRKGRGVLGEDKSADFKQTLPFLIPTNTTGSLLIEMVATATVGHILLACIRTLRVDASLPNRAWGTDA